MYENNTIHDRWIIQDIEAGNFIDEFSSLEEAQEALYEYERSDKKEGVYEENYYEIVKY